MYEVSWMNETKKNRTTDNIRGPKVLSCKIHKKKDEIHSFA